MSVAGLYFRFLGILDKRIPGTVIQPRSNKDSKKLHPYLRATISITNFFTIKFLVSPLLKEYGLAHAVAYHCAELNRKVKRTFVSVSVNGDVEEINKVVKSRLFFTIIHLCHYARIKHTDFILLYLSFEKNRILVTFDTNTPVFKDMDNSKDITLQLALDHIRQMKSELKRDCIGLKNQTFRLTLVVDAGASEIMEK